MTVRATQINKLGTELRERLEELEMLQEQKQAALDNAEGAEYPNEERIEKLQGQIEILEEAAQTLGDVCEMLENYE